MTTATDQLVLGPSDGEFVRFNAIGARFLLRGEQTGGRFSVVEHPLEPRALASPIHTHHEEDEYSFVLEGEMGAQIGGRVLRARAGDLVMKPRGVPHAFWNPGDVPARVLEFISPAGFERYFEEMAEVFAPGEPPKLERMPEILARYRLEVDRESLEPLAREHRLWFQRGPDGRPVYPEGVSV